MTGYCGIHGVPLTWMESKTKFSEDGTPKKYQAHRSDQGLCFGDKTKPSSQPPQQVSTYQGNPGFGVSNGNGNVPKNYSPDSYDVVPRPDWDAIAAGKVRHGFAIEAYKMGMNLNEETVDIINNWVEYVMKGELAE